MFAIFGMFLYFKFRDGVAASYKDTSGVWSAVITKVPGVIYAIVIYFLNNAYRGIAVKLNEWGE